MPTRPNYGIDSPAIVLGMLVVGATATGAVCVLLRLEHPHPIWEIAVGVIGVYCLLAAGGMIAYSKAGKLRIREQLIESIPWRGDEIVLDVGCGRGLLLSGAANRLTTGAAIGLDRWIPGALSGNRPQAAVENARIEGVRERVAVTRGDIRRLPFADASFDVIASNFVVHELNSGAERAQMLREIVRVLKPGGRLALVDFIFTAECVRVLRGLGISDARRALAGSFLSFWLGAILNFGLVRTYRVTGTKPE
jgi:SAM-dependent methyltransferase